MFIFSSYLSLTKNKAPYKAKKDMVRNAGIEAHRIRLKSNSIVLSK
jgi:hypothetical protein